MTMRLILFALLPMYLSCTDESTTPLEHGPLAAMEGLPRERPLNSEDYVEDVASGPRFSAVVDGVPISSFDASSSRRGTSWSLFAGHTSPVDIRLQLTQLTPAKYFIDDKSGFNRAYLDDERCTIGEIVVLHVDEKWSTVSGTFNFRGVDQSGRRRVVTDGRFRNIPFDPPTKSPNYVLEATINGERWSAKQFEQFLGASFFTVTGHNRVGNVSLGLSSTHFIKPGIYQVENLEELSFHFEVGKTNHTLQEGTVAILINDGKSFTGTFQLESEGLSITKGRFRFFDQ